MNNENKPAFPLDSEAERILHEGYGFEYSGLTKREEFAKAAMQGLLANSCLVYKGDWLVDIEAMAVQKADGVLALLDSSAGDQDE